MNRKGFTLVEIIAMLVVISILMVIAVPNISGIIKKNRESQAIEDINKLVGNAKAKMDTDKVKPIHLNECLLFTLKSLDTNDDINKGLNEGEYDPFESFVIVTRKPLEGEYETNATSEYKYYIRLYEVKGRESGSGKTFMTRLSNGNPGVVDYDDFVKKPEDNFPRTGRYNTRLYPNSYEENPEDITGYVNDLWNESQLCDVVVGVYIK